MPIDIARMSIADRYVQDACQLPIDIARMPIDMYRMLEKGMRIVHVRDEHVRRSMLPVDWSGPLTEAFEEVLAENVKWDLQDCMRLAVGLILHTGFNLLKGPRPWKSKSRTKTTPDVSWHVNEFTSPTGSSCSVFGLLHWIAATRAVGGMHVLAPEVSFMKSNRQGMQCDSCEGGSLLCYILYL